jgi:lysozyme family protein
MALHDYHEAMKIELKFEGGKDDDPVDPGGRTNQGVIQREFSAWLRKNGKPNRDVFTMTDDERDQIYYVNYCLKIHYDEMPPGVGLVMLDGAINSGPAQSIKWVQRALGITADGVLGTVTIQRIMDHPDHDLLIAAILDRRMAFLRSLRTFGHFGGGWTKRVNTLKRVGQAWAMGSVGPEVIFIPNGNKKAKIVDAHPIPSTAPADIVASGGTVTTALSTAQTVVEPLAGTSDIFNHVLLAIVVLGALCAAFGVIYGLYVRNKAAKLNDALDLVQVAPTHNNDNLPEEVVMQYVDPNATGSATGNIAPGTVTASGRTAGDTEVRVNAPAQVPIGKAA